MTVWVVFIEDPHWEVTVRVFATRAAAEQAVRAFAMKREGSGLTSEPATLEFEALLEWMGTFEYTIQLFVAEVEGGTG